MVKMCVGEHEGVNFAGRDGRILPVALAPFLGALEQAAVNQGLEAVLAAGIRAGRSAPRRDRPSEA